MNQISPQLMQLLLPLVIIVPVFLLRARALGRKRPLKLGLLWLRPAVLVIVAVLALALPQPGMPVRQLLPMDWAMLALAGAVGAAGGWYLGRMMAIDVHPDKGTLMVQSSPVGLLVVLVLVILRLGLRGGALLEAAAWHLDVMLIIDMSMVFTVGLFAVRSLEMYLRAKRVMEQAGRLPS